MARNHCRDDECALAKKRAQFSSEKRKTLEVTFQFEGGTGTRCKRECCGFDAEFRATKCAFHRVSPHASEWVLVIKSPNAITHHSLFLPPFLRRVPPRDTHQYFEAERKFVA